MWAGYGQQSFEMKHLGWYCSLDLLDKKRLYLEPKTRNSVITENSY